MVALQKTKEGSSEAVAGDGNPTQSTNGNPGSPKSKLAMLKRSSARAKANTATSDPFRFQDNGVDFKGKFIGEREVTEPRGDTICAEAMQLAKASVKSSGSHKQRITLNISIEGLKIRDQKTGSIIYNFPVSKISFIARDTTDARAFGFIFGMSNGKYRFYGIKTAQTADNAVLAIRDMFQVVFEMKKKQIQEVKQKQEEQQNAENLMRESKDKQNGVTPSDYRMDGGVAVADLLDLETELECIEQGFNQLQNVPHMPEDDYNFEAQWNNSNGTSGNGNDLFGLSGNGSVTTTNGVLLTTRDPFDVSFVNAPISVPFASSAPLPISPAVFPMESRQHFNENGVSGIAFNHTKNGLINHDPFDVSHVVGSTISASIPPSNALHNDHNKHIKNGFCGVLAQNGTFNNTPPISSLHAYGVQPMENAYSPMSLIATAPIVPNVFENGQQRHQSNGNVTNKDPFDDSFFNSKTPFSTDFSNPFLNDKMTPKWNNENEQSQQQHQKSVTTLEEAFSKLVNMDQLVPTVTNSVGGLDGGSRKNPFEHIINPPKMPMNALVTTTSHFH